MAGRDSVFLTEKIRAASDIVDVVGAFVTLRRAGRNFIGLCPFHKEKSPSFNVHPERQTFHCFGCKAGGDVYKFVQLREGVEFMEAREILARRANIDLQENVGAAQRESGGIGKSDLERVNQWAARWFRARFESDAGSDCRKYVADRGITDESAAEFGLGFAPDGWSALNDAARKAGISEAQLTAAGLVKRRDAGEGAYDAFRNRLMFPIHDPLSRIIAFGGRALGDDKAKYLNSPQTALFDKSKALYGMLQSRESWKESKRAIITEGYLDCILCHQAGFKDVVATLGTAMTAEHVGLLTRYRIDSAVLVFDADEAGQKAADRAIGVILPHKMEIRIAQVPEGMDPADVIVNRGGDAFANFLTRATPALEFKWGQVVHRWGGAVGDGDRRRAVEEFLGVIATALNERSIDPIQRGFLQNQVGKLLGLRTDQVERQLRMIASRTRTSSVEEAREARVGLSLLKDGRQAALREILTVLLNAPDRYSAVDDIFDPAAIADPTDRRIAQATVELIESNEGFEITRLIGRFADTGVSSRITELLCQGEIRENFEASIGGAALRLRAIETQKQLAASFSAMRDRAPNLNVVEDENVMAESSNETRSSDLDLVIQTARRSSHFVARRHLAALTKPGADRRGPASSGEARPAK